MKPQSLVNNTHPQEAEPGQYWHGKNGLWDQKRKALMNEPGFLPSSVSIPYTPNGIIETDTVPIVFSTDNTYSAFGFFDETTDTYTPIFNDSTKSFKLNFDTSRPIKGEARRNYLDQVEIAWFEIGLTDANPPRFSNTVTPGQNLNDFLLFPQAVMPKIGLTITGAGNLPMGAFFAAVKYLKKDGTQTRYGTLSAPVFATSDGFTTIPGTNTGKALGITLTDIDTNYDTLIICIVQRINGVDTPYELPEIAVAPTIAFLYTGTENVAQITMDEVLIPGADYRNVQAMTQLEDTLYMGDIAEAETIDWQKYANMVRLRWKSTAYSVGAHPVPDRDSGKVRGFMHQEVYAFYIVLKTRTGNSRGFIVPGPPATMTETTTSALGTAQGMTEPKYLLEDTVKNIDTGDRSGDFGVWLNQDEVYPNIDSFDSTSIGGPDLRGQQVRHFRFPSIRFCKNTFYSTNNDYGRTVLDVLGVEAFNIQIPVELQDRVIGWELYYAQRDFNNATVVGQSLLLFGSQANAFRSSPGNVRSTGGNWGSYQRTHSSGGTADGESLFPRNDSIRFLALDLLTNKPAIIPSHLSIQLGLVIRWPTPTTNTFVNTANQVCFWLDYCNHVGNVDAPLPIPDSKFIRKLSEQQYIVNDETSGHFNNTRLEGGFVAKLPTPGSGLMDGANWSWMRRDYDQGHNTPPAFEQTYLANLMINRSNVYQAFYSQTLARTGFTFDTSQNNSDIIIYGGDTFASFNSFNTYGLVTDRDVQNDTGVKDWKTAATDGIKVVRTFVAETVSNQAARYELAGNIYSGFIPRENTDGLGLGFLADFSRDVEPNQIGYDKSDNAIGTLLNGIAPANPNSIFVNQSPHKIIRSIKQLAEGKVNNWKNYNALDYFEMNKDKGRITNLQGMGDILIIHLSEAFYRTRSKETLSTDLAQITLGSGDIFALTPKETRPSKLGYAGTQHPLACYLTPVGYVFPDARTGEVFLFDGEELRNISEGVRRFLNEYMRNSDYNPFSGNGITIGYDWKYERILFTVKNIKLVVGLENFVPGYQPTPEFYAGLTPGQSIVYIRGRFLLYQGENTSVYMCDSLPVPQLNDDEVSIDEHSPNGTLIDTAVATDGLVPYTYSIVGGNPYGAVSIDPVTGEITVSNSTVFDWVLTPVLTLSIQVTDANSNTAIATFTVNLNHIPSTPYIAPQVFSIPDTASNGDLVGVMMGSNRDGGTPLWAIISGNTDGIFDIDSLTGAVTILDNTLLADGEYDLGISLTMSGETSSIVIPVHVTPGVVAPTWSGTDTFSTAHTTANGTLIGLFLAATCPNPVDYILESYNNTGAINIDIDPSSGTFGNITILNNAFLTIGIDNIWVIRCYNTVDPTLYVDVTITIHIT
jgi:hypothetical protein